MIHALPPTQVAIIEPSTRNLYSLAQRYYHYVSLIQEGAIDDAEECKYIVRVYNNLAKKANPDNFNVDGEDADVLLPSLDIRKCK